MTGFDPTIFDNLKVVLEGELYDLDREGAVLLTGRSDAVDLATLARTFAAIVRRPGGACEASLSLCAGLPDFAGELAGLRLAGAEPGAALALGFRWKGGPAFPYRAAYEALHARWDDRGSVSLRRSAPLLPEPADAATDFEARIAFPGKIDENRIDELPAFLALVVDSLAAIDALAEKAGPPAD